MVTNVSWHTSKCWIITFVSELKSTYIIMLSLSQISTCSFTWEKKLQTNSYSFFPSLQKRKQLRGVAIKQRWLGSSFVFSSCFLNTVLKLYLFALLSLILYLITDFLKYFFMSLFCTYDSSKDVLGQSGSFHDFLLSRKKNFQREKHSGLLRDTLGFTFEDKVKAPFSLWKE